MEPLYRKMILIFAELILKHLSEGRADRFSTMEILSKGENCDSWNQFLLIPCM